MMTLAILVLVEQMQNARTENVHVCLNIKAIHTRVVDPNVFPITIVLETKHAQKISALIHAPELVLKMRFVTS
jgi:glutamate/tyrosine decarboxylase-like PLP-dependent enzyme